MIFTIGYQKLKFAKLQLLLAAMDAKLIDVRSVPFSRNASFRQSYLMKMLRDGYVFKGDVLGGRGNVRPSGIEYLRQYHGMDKPHCVLMCMEHAAGDCHRHHAITSPYFPESLHLFENYVIQSDQLDIMLADEGGEFFSYSVEDFNLGFMAD